MKTTLLRACAAIGFGVLAVACTQTPGTGGTTTTSSTIPNSPPVAVISPSTTSAHAPVTITFDGSDSTDDDAITSYDWDFGDSTTATGPSVTHTYHVAGIYEVVLQVTDGDNETDLATVTVTVTDDPAGRYVATTGTDAGACQASASPCLTVGYAVTQAVTNDTVHVAAGTYPELVSVDKSLTFKGANAGIHAGVAAGTRGAESIVKGFRNPGNPGTVQYDFTLDGFRIDPQGDAALIGATTQPLVWIHGGPTVSIVNNVMSGGPFVPNCTYTCTAMTDYAVTVRSGDIDISDNRIENFRRPVNVNQSTPGTPITSAAVSNNVITGVTSRGISIAPSTGQNAMPGISVTGNQVDAVGRTAPSSPAGITVSSHDNVISGNTFTGLSSGVYIDLCKKFSTQNNDISDNTFSGNGTGLSIGVNQDGGACINGTAEGSGNWVVGGGKLDGLSVNGNTFSGNTSYAIRHNPNWVLSWDPGSVFVPVYSTGPLDASCNFYGNASGPTNAANPSGTGEAVSFPGPPHAELVFTPWLTSAGGACDGTP